MDSVNVLVKQELFERLKGIAEPLVDDVNSVLERLLNHWDATGGARRVAPRGERQVWRSARGEEIEVGTKLRAKYLKVLYEAEVTADGIEFDGVTYDNPSSAAIAVKRAAGTGAKSANTNGWDFWEFRNPKTRLWAALDTLRPKSSI